MKEQEIENILIKALQDLKYTYRSDITTRDALHSNFRAHFEALNRVHLTPNEFERLLEKIITPNVFNAAKILREQATFERDDGTPLFYTLIDHTDWCKNTFEFVNQLRINTDNSHHRYDVILLMNGIPVVQIELKSLNISPRKAMQQIVNYKNDAGNGYGRTLLCFIQLFIVSNRSTTWYFANNNLRHFAFNAEEQFLPVYQFADEKNKKITNLDAFTDAFLAKCTLAEMISRYMVLVASEQKLLMMRPYQIYAVQQIVHCIEQNCGNGYIWHTTGSGKTLTSFKASTLLKDNPKIEKCLFVVDRKDLDRQTREEFNKFQENCVEENTNTATLVRRLLSEDKADKVIVTTIQKLGLALDERRNPEYRQQLAPLSKKRLVFIFDECHRSQFGDNHDAIKTFFPEAQLFGFTGTPIFDKNAAYTKREGKEGSYKTTADVFQNLLHAYTITHAIEDRNVLRFHVDYFKPQDDSPLRFDTGPLKRAVVESLLAKHDAATDRRKFNALFATDSINDAIAYYALFKEIQADKKATDADYEPLRIACVFSPPAEGNKDVQQIQEDLPQERADNAIEPEKKKAALSTIIGDYNKAYGGNHSLYEFDTYYKDIQQRIKDQKYPNKDHPQNQKIDIAIVVDMLLTGFDSSYLAALYVDKKLQYHNLIQAFSRTNRVLNDTKPWGKVLTFRDQRDAVDAAIIMFSGEESDAARKIWLVDKAPVIINTFKQAVDNLQAFMLSQSLECTPSEVNNLSGDEAKCQFINLFKEIQRSKNQLDQYTDLTDAQKHDVNTIMPADDLQAFRGSFLVTVEKLKAEQAKFEATTKTGSGADAPEKTEAEQAALQQLDFELVLFASALIDYDYIMGLIARQSKQPASEQKRTRQQLIGLITADAKFLGERDTIVDYIQSLPLGEALEEKCIKEGYEIFKAAREVEELHTIATTHGIDVAALSTFVDKTLLLLVFDAEALRDLFIPLNLNWKQRSDRELAFMKELTPVLQKRAEGTISGLSAYD